MKTCKECEHYEKYDGPKKTSTGEKMVMFCPNRQKAVGYGYFANIMKCTDFTPKKPVEKTCKECENADKPGWKFHCEQWRKGDDLSHEACKCSFTPKKPVEPERKCGDCRFSINNNGTGQKCDDYREKIGMYPSVCRSEDNNNEWQPNKPVEKSCETCGARRENNSTGEPCNVFLGVPSGNCKEDSNWRPIKPVEKKTCGTCGNAMVIANTTNSTWCKKWDGNRKIFYFCDSWQPIKPDKPKAEVPEKKIGGFVGCYDLSDRDRDELVLEKLTQETKKEKTMSRMKKLIRKYIMACTLYCTAVICIALNPYVIWLCYKVLPMGNGQIEDANHVDIFMCWFSTITAIAVVLLAIHVFNYITAYVFGKLEK